MRPLCRLSDSFSNGTPLSVFMVAIKENASFAYFAHVAWHCKSRMRSPVEQMTSARQKVNGDVVGSAAGWKDSA